MRNPRKPYVPDLKELSGICESNYLHLLKLMPKMDAGESREFNITGGVNHATSIRLKVVEQFKYTQGIMVEQVSDLHDYLTPPRMEVRMYHDLRTAEVISFDNNHRFNGVYHYPNPQMRLPDEKHQINHFLSDWLTHCFLHGEADIELNFHPHSIKCDSSTRSD